jgi:vacuolar-type H+-ATPase subunit I/STV1
MVCADGRTGEILEKRGDAVKNLVARKLIRNFALELLVYAALVVGYFFLVLRFLADPLENLFANNLILYAFIALGLIVAQAVLLETVTSFVMGLLGLDQLE